MNEADQRRAFEIKTLARMESLETARDNGAIARNARAMKDTIEHWNKEYIALDTRIAAVENNIANLLQIVKDIQSNNALALQKLRGTGPTT